MQIDGLIPFKSSTYQAIASLYFMRILISFYSFSSVKSAAMITGFGLLAPKNAYFRCLGNSFITFSNSCIFSSLLLNFYTLSLFRLNTVSFNSKMTFRYSTSRSSIY